MPLNQNSPSVGLTWDEELKLIEELRHRKSKMTLKASPELLATIEAVDKMKFESQLNKQYGGKHYKGSPLQPVEIAYRNKLCFRIFSSLKYLFRHDKEGGEKELDIKKAIHYLQFLLEQEYGVYSNIEYSMVSSQEIRDILNEPDELKDHDDEHIHRNSK